MMTQADKLQRGLAQISSPSALVFAHHVLLLIGALVVVIPISSLLQLLRIAALPFKPLVEQTLLQVVIQHSVVLSQPVLNKCHLLLARHLSLPVDPQAAQLQAPRVT